MAIIQSTFSTAAGATIAHRIFPSNTGKCWVTQQNERKRTVEPTPWFLSEQPKPRWLCILADTGSRRRAPPYAKTSYRRHHYNVMGKFATVYAITITTGIALTAKSNTIYRRRDRERRIRKTCCRLYCIRFTQPIQTGSAVTESRGRRHGGYGRRWIKFLPT